MNHSLSYDWCISKAVSVHSKLGPRLVYLFNLIIQMVNSVAHKPINQPQKGLAMFTSNLYVDLEQQVLSVYTEDKACVRSIE